ncbi:MAG: HisA/HisF family protein, partial [Candidatus Hydrothermarchaeota archaeon]|nr:HisA/HisF family protein [Candidatus Hydrothermarchaeota archaeon]
MEIIPVLDIMHGKAVSGKSGERKKYQELKTVFASSPDP